MRRRMRATPALDFASWRRALVVAIASGCDLAFSGVWNARVGGEDESHERRKVVTVIFADVVGSTALGERVDPETLRWAMQRWFERMVGAIEGHGGTVENFIGDAVMGVFGVQVVHEDDALRAVRAAAEMREESCCSPRGSCARSAVSSLGYALGSTRARP